MVAAVPGQPHHTAWTAIPAEEVLPGVTRQTVHGERQTFVRYVYAPGSVFPVHAHPEEQITLVLSGRIAFEIDGVRMDAGPGELIVIPGNVPHGARVIGNESVETVNTFSPRRDAGPRATPGISETGEA